MNKNKSILLFAAFSGILLSLSNCTPQPIPIKIPGGESKMVVSSQVIPNSNMLVALTRSFNALTPTDSNPGNTLLDQILVAHAFVTVSYNGKTDTLYRVAPGFYGTVTTPLIDDVTYQLRVYDSSSGKSISADTRMMKRILLDTAFTTMEIKGKDTSRFLNLTFTDLSGQDYYMVNIYRNSSFIRNTVTNPIDVFNLNNNGDVRTLPLSDQTFDKKFHNEKINIDNFNKNDTLRVTLSHVEGNYYRYLVQKEKSAQNGLGNFFGEPVNYITNVLGGYGFFTAYWPDSRMLIIKE